MPHLFSTRVLGPLALSAAAALSIAVVAHAGEKNPAVEACAGKSAGDACDVVRLIKSNEGQPETRKSPGQCATDECCELDYSKGSPPETICGPCLACKAGSPRPTPDAPEVKGDGGDSNGEPPRTSSEPPPATPSGKRGCSVGGVGPTWSWLVLGLAPLLLRRRND